MNVLQIAKRHSLTAVFLVPMWLGFYWVVIDNHNPISAATQTLVDEDGIVNRDEGMQVRRVICSSSDVKVDIVRHFLDGVRYSMPTINNVTLHKGCHDVMGMVDVPHSLPAGKYLYQVDLSVQINPFKHIDVAMNPMPLIIAANPTSPFSQKAGDSADTAFPGK